MAHGFLLRISRAMALAFAFVLCVTGAAFSINGTVGPDGDGEMLIPGIWVDPDGCEHWVMDDGFEGYMSPVLMHDGRPVCGRDPNAPPTCGLLSTDTFFATDKAVIPPRGVEHIRAFFKSNRRHVFLIDGHTDSRASDAYNIDLSQRRANAVAAIAAELGANVREVRAFGERQPRAPNTSADGMAMNRRVEIICVK